MKPAQLSAASLLDVVSQGESAFIEFKSSFQKEVIETLTAFANTQGGAVLIGVSDAGQVVGVSVQAETVHGCINQCKQGRPTFACHLLFSKNDVFLSTIEAGRFASSTLIKDSITSRDTLVEQVQRIMDFMVKHTNKAYIITGNPRREERWDYPMDALREIVINMIVHRDYRSANDSTIKVFDDRIEFFNPGILLDDLTVEKIKTGNYKSHLRNKQIATIFKELELIEKYGSGVRRVIDSFVAYGLPEPEFETTQGGVSVTVFKAPAKTHGSALPESIHEKVNVGANVGANGLLAYIQANPGQRAGDMAVTFAVTQRTIERWLKQHKENGLIEFRGAAKTGGYYTKDK